MKLFKWCKIIHKFQMYDQWFYVESKTNWSLSMLKTLSCDYTRVNIGSRKTTGCDFYCNENECHFFVYLELKFLILASIFHWKIEG